MSKAQPPAEERLTGGNMEPVVRVGETVRRVAGPWTHAVHALLEALAREGPGESPRALGIDETGREVLTFVPGTILDDAPASVRWSEAMLTQAAALLRRLHDASAELAHEDQEWRTATHRPVEVVCHNDFAPYNLLVHGDRLTGVIDFDMASPGPRIWDVAYLAYRLVPFAEDAVDEANATPTSQSARLDRLIDAYGVRFAPSEVLSTICERLDELADFTDGRATATGRTDLVQHAAMYRRDAIKIAASGPF